MEKIKELRIANNLSQIELAEKLQIAQNTLSQYENGKRDPDIDTLKKIADYFDVTTDYLLERDNNLETIAAHHDDDEWTEEELEDIEKFKEYIRSKRED